MAEIVKSSSLETFKKFYTSDVEGVSQAPTHAFERDRKMNFRKLFNFLMIPRTLSESVEIFRYSKLINSNDVTKSDVSQRRALIPSGYIKETFERSVGAVYSDSKDIDMLDGHILLAADGTTYSMPNTPELRLHFLQGRKTGRSQQALSRGVVIKDVINDMIVAANAECYGRDEIELLLECVDGLPEHLLKLSPLLLLDRKYCAYTLISKLMSMKIDFIIRVKAKFNEAVDDFINSKKKSATVELNPAGTTIKKLKRLYGSDIPTSQFKVRLERLDSGVIVMTSLLEGIPVSESDIYHKRWDDETTIGFLKNNLQVEIFSGTKINSIYQDFYAKATMYNFLSAIIRQAAELHLLKDGRTGSASFRINRNVALGIFKFCLPALLNSRHNFRINLAEMLKEMTRHTVPVKTNRHNPRVFRKIKHSGKYITLTNYARAI